MAAVIAKSVDDAAKQKNSWITIETAVRLAGADAVFGNRKIFLNRFYGHRSEIAVDGHYLILPDAPGRVHIPSRHALSHDGLEG